MINKVDWCVSIVLILCLVLVHCYLLATIITSQKYYWIIFSLSETSINVELKITHFVKLGIRTLRIMSAINLPRYEKLLKFRIYLQNFNLVTKKRLSKKLNFLWRQVLNMHPPAHPPSGSRSTACWKEMLDLRTKQYLLLTMLNSLKPPCSVPLKIPQIKC